MVLLDAGSFVVDVQRGDHAIGDDPGTKYAGSGLDDGAVNDELYLFGATNVQVFSDHIFKEDVPAHRLIQNLGEGKFELENGELITVSGLTVLGGEQMGESSRANLRKVSRMAPAFRSNYRPGRRFPPRSGCSKRLRVVTVKMISRRLGFAR